MACPAMKSHTKLRVPFSHELNDTHMRKALLTRGLLFLDRHLILR